MEIAILALGCFWKPEMEFDKFDGIVKTEVGYCGGNVNKTNYEEVCAGKTNHAEVVKIEFDTSRVSYEDLFNYFSSYNLDYKYLNNVYFQIFSQKFFE